MIQTGRTDYPQLNVEKVATPEKVGKVETWLRSKLTPETLPRREGPGRNGRNREGRGAHSPDAPGKSP